MASQLTVYLLDPTHVVAMSLDGDVSHAGPWQASPVFLKDPAGNDFVNGRPYYIHEQDLLTPDRYIPVIVRVFNDGSTTAGGSVKDGKDGLDGTKFYTATVDPSAIGGTLGVDGDFCINKTSGDVFQRIGNLPNTTAGTWVLSFNITGPRGLPGAPGTGSGGTGSSGVTYMTGDDRGIQNFPAPPAGHEHDVATWQVIYQLCLDIYTSSSALSGRVYAVETALSNKVDKVTGKGLSEQNYTFGEKQKLASLNGYNLPTAKPNELGGVKIGNDFSVTPDGIISLAAPGGRAASLNLLLINSGITRYIPI